MENIIYAEPLSAGEFAPYGDILDTAGDADKLINQGLCQRFHDRAQLDFGPGGRAGISIFQAKPRTLPYSLDMMERHPEGSQAFVPMSENPFLIVVAPDDGGVPGMPRAFLTAAGQAINYHRNTWHGVLTPIGPPGLFAVIDRIGTTPNIEEHWFETPFMVLLDQQDRHQKRP